MTTADDSPYPPLIRDTVVRRVVAARYLYSLGADQARLHGEAAAITAVSLLQDAVETFLIAVRDHRSAPEKKDFLDQYDAVNASVGNVLALRDRLNVVNKLRVHAKHQAILPDSRELERAVADVRAFLDDAAPKVFGAPISAITLINQLATGEERQLLQEAQDAYDREDYRECLIASRKAFFLTFERNADTSIFVNSPPNALMYLSAFDAPSFARSREYYNAHVNEPTDAIVLDVAKVQVDIIADGIDPTVFWNVRRLTPPVIRLKDRGWVVRQDDTVWSGSDLQDRASFVLDSIIDMLLRRQHKRRTVRSLRERAYMVSRTKRPGVCLYAKADRNSFLVHAIQEAHVKMTVQHYTEGLSDPGIYCRVSVPKEPGFGGLLNSWYGYVLADDLEPAPLGPEEGVSPDADP